MATLKGNWFSETLKMDTHVTVCMPDLPKQAKATVICSMASRATPTYG